MPFHIFSLLSLIAFTLLPIVDSSPADEDFHSDQSSENMVEIVGNKSWGGDKTFKPPSKEFISIDFDPAKMRGRTEADAWEELATDRDRDKGLCHYNPNLPSCVLMPIARPTPVDNTPAPEPDWPSIITITEVAHIPVTPSPINMWPASGDVIIQVDTPYWTTQSPQLFTLQILGYPINVRFTPLSFDWDFGDGTTISTTEAGTPLPNNTQAHQYRRKIPKTRITLTTYWSADFQHPTTHHWHHITGTLRTTTHSRWFATKMHYAHLTNEAEKHQNH